MDTLFIYLVKSGGLLAAFYLAYFFLLRKETFFNSNRWFLLLGLVTSLLLPLVTFKKIIWVDPVPQGDWSQIPANLVNPASAGFEIDWFIVAALVYAVGIFIFLIKFLFDFGSLVRTLKGQPIRQQADFKYVDVTHNVSPFSYFNYIVYNSALYSQSELENILEHEKVHCEQKHSADVLIARLFCILFWFNPFAWLYKKAMLQNLEFIADSEALKNISDKRAYQITLLKVTTHDNCVEITNHFYQSLIKKRIIMLNKNQSKKWNSWKYALIVPVLAAFMFYFQIKVIAQERQNADVATLDVKPTDIVLNKNTTDAQLKAYSNEFKEKFGAKLKFSKVKRNSAGEITEIKVQYDDKKGKSGSWHVREDKPINSLRLSRKDDGSIAFGGNKQIRIIKKDGDGEETETVTDDDDDEGYSYAYNYDDNGRHVIVVNGEEIEMPEAPEAPEMPDLPGLPDVAAPPAPPMPPAGFGNNVIVKTFTNKDGKVVVSVNGEVIEVDTDKILADLDINLDELKQQAEEGSKLARKQARLARRQAELARPQMERARERAKDAEDNSEDARQEMENAKREMEQTRREMEQARRELDKAREQLAKEKAEMKAKSKSSNNK
jgi:hypothetical protein